MWNSAVLSSTPQQAPGGKTAPRASGPGASACCTAASRRPTGESVRIIYLHPEPFEPPSTGGRVRRASLYRALKNLGHTVELHFRSAVSTQARSSALTVTDSRNVPSRLNWPVRVTSPVELRMLNDMIRVARPDVAIAEYPAYGDLGPWAQLHGVPLILVAQNYESGWSALRNTGRSLLDHCVILSAEALYLRGASAVWAISPEDAAQYARVRGSNHVDYIPFSVPLPDAPTRQPRDDLPFSSLLFVGSYSWAPNVRAARFLAREVLPALRRLQPNVRMVFAGRNPPAWLRRLECDTLRVLGEVPDLAPHYRQADIVVAPENVAFGVKTKILEAMAHAKPVVTTSAGVRGIQATPSVDYVRAPWNGAGFARAVSTALADENNLARLGSNARSLIARHHTFEATCSAIATSLARFL